MRSDFEAADNHSLVRARSRQKLAFSKWDTVDCDDLILCLSPGKPVQQVPRSATSWMATASIPCGYYKRHAGGHRRRASTEKID